MNLQQLILLCVIFIVQQGSSQDPCDESVSVGVAGGPITVSVDGSSSAVPVPVCIRCGYSVGFTFTPVVDPSLVTYVNNTNGQTITMNTTDIIITNNGLILNDSASSFDDGESITCNFDDGTMSGSHIITIDIFIFNPPPITPVGDILDYIEGDTVTLTCTGDSQIFNDRYQWTLPDGTLDPENPAIADTGLNLLLTNINRAQSGVYICTGIIPAEIVKSNVTLNIQYVNITSFTPDNSTVTVGSILTLNCTFDGNPSPSVLWSHNGSMLDVQNNPNVEENITDTYGLLKVTFADITVSGEYACGVNNTIGVDETDFTFFTVQVAPGPVETLVNDSSTDKCISLSWTYGFIGNAPITGVDIAYEAIDNNATAHSGSTTSNQTSITICNLQSLTTYEFTVTVNNSVSSIAGASSPSNVSAQTGPLVPNKPTIVSVTPVSSTALTVTWTSSIDELTQTPILAFEISYKIKDSSDTVTTVIVNDPSATSETITDLKKGEVYEVSIVSGNSAGPSPPSDVVERRTNIDPPSAVSSLLPTANPFSICVAWSEPSDNGGQNITEYKIERWDISQYPTMENFTFVTTELSAVLSYTIENLANDTEYSIRVTASNIEGGFGEPDMVNASTGQALTVDDSFLVTLSNISAISVMVAWTVPTNDNNIEYRLQIVQEEDDFNPDLYTIFPSDVRSGEVKELNPNSTYYIRMTRIEGGGCVRQVSETMDFETLDFEIRLGIESSTPTVVAGNEIVLECVLSTGQAAPNVVWNRVDGDIPNNANIVDNTLTIPNPSVDDSGDYMCTSSAGINNNEQVTFSFSLLVLPPPSTSIMQTTPTTTLTVLESTDSFPTWAIGAVAAGAFICILLFVVVLIIFIYCCCCRNKEEKGKARYDLAKPAGKKAATGNMWLDEGASGFSSIPQYNGDDTEAPVGRGRTMTNDYVSATSFNTLDKKGSTEKLTDLHEGRQTDV